jgi:hypothetical protein
LLVIVIGLSFFAVFSFRQGPDADNPRDEQKTAAENTRVADSQAKDRGLESDDPPVKAAPQKWALHVIAVEKTWLKVIMDEKAPAEYHLNSGDQLELEAASGFNLLIGNAGGLKLSLNDKPVLIPGESGEVVTIELP